MSIKKPFAFIGTGMLILLSSNSMAFDFPLPGTGGNTGGTPDTGSNTVIFSCKTNEIGSSLTNNGSSSCENTGGTSSSCSSGNTSGSTGSAVVAYEMTSTNTDLESVLLNAATCAEAVKAAGDCSPSGGDATIIYTCTY